MTAGREQDARETLRALSEAATPGPWYVDAPDHAYVGNRADGRTAGLWAIVHMSGDVLTDLADEASQRALADARLIAAAVNYVRAALLPSPPATTGAGEDELERLRALVGDPDYDAERWGTVSRAEAIRQANWFHAEMTKWADLFYQVRDERDEARAALAASSPPATDGDAASLTHWNHVYAPGIDVDDPEHPDPRWCNTCGESVITGSVMRGVPLRVRATDGDAADGCPTCGGIHRHGGDCHGEGKPARDAETETRPT